MINRSGYNSCLKCLHSEKGIKTSKGGHKRVFMYQQNKSLKRNKTNYTQHASKAEINNVVSGIKGRSILGHLKYRVVQNVCQFGIRRYSNTFLLYDWPEILTV